MGTEYGCACRWAADRGLVSECATHAALREENARLKMLADCGATSPEPCRTNPPCMVCYALRLTRERDEARAEVEAERAYADASNQDAIAAEAEVEQWKRNVDLTGAELRDAEARLARCVEALALMYDEWMDQGHNDPSAPLLCMHSEMAERMARVALAAIKGGE